MVEGWLWTERFELEDALLCEEVEERLREGNETAGWRQRVAILHVGSHLLIVHNEQVADVAVVTDQSGKAREDRIVHLLAQVRLLHEEIHQVLEVAVHLRGVGVWHGRFEKRIREFEKDLPENIWMLPPIPIDHVLEGGVQ